jgi:P pilus assembly chaperone PapD
MRGKRSMLFPFLLAGVLAGQAPPPQEAGIGGLMLLPTRVLLEGRTRSAEVLLRNSGAVASTYRIEVKEMAMDQDGQVQERPRKEGEITVGDFLFFSPKQVDLAPGEAQTVRLQIHKPDGLADGEYRSHLVFQAIPPPAPAEPLDAGPEKKVSINVNMILAASIPVTVRQGRMTGQIKLSGLRYLEHDDKVGGPALALRLERQGNCSVRGDLTATVASGGKLKPGTLLYDLKNVVVYAETPFRNMRMPLNQDGIKGARIKVTFQATELSLPLETAFLDLAP